MGNSSTKLAEKCSLLSRDEVPVVASSFKLVSKNSERIKEDDLMKFWGSQMDPRLAQYITNFLFGAPANRTNIVEFQRFAELYVYSVRGTYDDRISVLLASIGQSDSDIAEIAYPLIKEYVEAVVSSYMRAVRLEGGCQFKSWESKGFRIVKECIQKLTESLAAEVVQQGTQKVTRQDAVRWLQRTPTFVKMLEYVFIHLYSYRPTTKNPQEEAISIRRKSIVAESNKLLPFCEGLQYVPDYPAYRIVDQGPSVIIIEDTNGAVFGGFPPASWAYNPKFVGDDSAFLFTLRPKMRCFPTTGYNDHYQYLNLHQQTMPNGLGLGGQFNYWGLWLDCEYGQGECSESCSTFKNYAQLSMNKQFEIRNIEVWDVGEKPTKDDDEAGNGRSILDGNLEEQAILEMSGRGRISDGYRDEPCDSY